MTEIIWDRGRLILQVGKTDESHKPQDFLVSSDVLQVSSRVFSKMLDPFGPFVESRSSTVKLPDDSIDAFRIVLLVLHQQVQNVAKSVPIELLQDVAIVCHKYEIASAMKVEVLGRMQTLSNVPQSTQAFIQYCFSDWNGLRVTTKQLLLNMTYDEKANPLDPSGAPFIPEFPQVLLDIMSTARSRLITATLGDFYNLIPKLMQDTMCTSEASDGQCECLALGVLMRVLFRHDFYRHSRSIAHITCSINDLCSKLGEMKEIWDIKAQKRHRYYYNPFRTLVITANERTKIFLNPVDQYLLSRLTPTKPLRGKTTLTAKAAEPKVK